MEDYEQKSNWLSWVLGGLTIVLLGGGIYYWNQNQKLARLNDRSEQRADSLLSVRLQLESDMRHLNDQLTSAQEDNTALTKRLDENNRQLTANQARMRELRQGNYRQSLTLRDLNQQVSNITMQRDSMGNQMNAMQNKIGWMTDSAAVMTSRNEQLSQQINSLNATMLTMVPRTLLTGDDFRIEATKANQKETAKAKKVNALTISFNVPVEMGLTGSQEVYLSLTDEQRKAVVDPMRTETINLPNSTISVPVHATQTVAFGQNANRIVFLYKPDSSLKPGVYRAAVYTKNAYLGSVEFRFRDSFWFF